MTFIWIKNGLSGTHKTIFYILILLCTFYTLFHFHNSLITFQYPILNNNVTSTTYTTSCYYSTFTMKDNINQTSFYYRHATSARNSSYPYISGDTFRALSDYIYDETRRDNLSSVKYGGTVFVKTDMLSLFFTRPFNSIRNPFVLITHNSDYSAPMKYRTYLSNRKILSWYSSNPSERNHPKLYPIPIGLANTRWAQGNLDKLTYASKTYRKPWSQRTVLLYVNFSVKTNKVERRKALSQATAIENAQIIKTRVAFEPYLEQIGNAKYVLSPPGNGLDCHRTWEALLMGAVPIVLSSALDPLFSKSRSVVIDDWSKLTLSFLLSLNFSSNDHLAPDVLHAHYWRETLVRYRNKQ